MPRTWKKDAAKKHRTRIDADQLKKAIEAVKSGMAQVEASRKFNVDRRSLQRRLYNPGTNPHTGRVSALSPQLERIISQRMVTLANWGYPLELHELKIIIKNYLDLNAITIPVFNDNAPGYDYLHSFLKRNDDLLTRRVCSNIKRSRAAVGYKEIKEFFDNLEPVLNNVPPENIFNYDETNFTDDPGSKKVVCGRKTKYVERIMNSSKSSTSVMFVGSAAGTMLPPYIVYKATHMYNSWINGGPPGARYNRTQNGWFDSATFVDWLENLIVPNLRLLEGKKFIIGDNLSAHISIQAIEVCEAHDIHFIFFPPNSTHLLQPLDVAVFSSVKSNWRSILTEWKMKEGPNETSIPKCVFPSLQRKLMTQIADSVKENIISGFRKCGIVPFNPSEVLSRLPQGLNQEQNQDIMNDTLISYLQSTRPQVQTVKKARKKLNILPGKSISIEDLEAGLNEPGPSNAADTPSEVIAGPSRPQTTTKKNNKRPLPKCRESRTCIRPPIVESEDEEPFQPSDSD